MQTDIPLVPTAANVATDPVIEEPTLAPALAEHVKKNGKTFALYGHLPAPDGRPIFHSTAGVPWITDAEGYPLDSRTQQPVRIVETGETYAAFKHRLVVWEAQHKATGGNGCNGRNGKGNLNLTSPSAHPATAEAARVLDTIREAMEAKSEHMRAAARPQDGVHADIKIHQAMWGNFENVRGMFLIGKTDGQITTKLFGPVSDVTGTFHEYQTGYLRGYGDITGVTGRLSAIVGPMDGLVGAVDVSGWGWPERIDKLMEYKRQLLVVRDRLNVDPEKLKEAIADEGFQRVTGKLMKRGNVTGDIQDPAVTKQLLEFILVRVARAESVADKYSCHLGTTKDKDGKFTCRVFTAPLSNGDPDKEEARAQKRKEFGVSTYHPVYWPGHEPKNGSPGRIKRLDPHPLDVEWAKPIEGFLDPAKYTNPEYENGVEPMINMTKLWEDPRFDGHPPTFAPNEKDGSYWRQDHNPDGSKKGEPVLIYVSYDLQAALEKTEDLTEQYWIIQIVNKLRTGKELEEKFIDQVIRGLAPVSPRKPVLDSDENGAILGIRFVAEELTEGALSTGRQKFDRLMRFLARPEEEVRQEEVQANPEPVEEGSLEKKSEQPVDPMDEVDLPPAEAATEEKSGESEVPKKGIVAVFAKIFG